MDTARHIYTHENNMGQFSIHTFTDSPFFPEQDRRYGYTIEDFKSATMHSDSGFKSKEDCVKHAKQWLTEAELKWQYHVSHSLVATPDGRKVAPDYVANYEVVRLAPKCSGDKVLLVESDSHDCSVVAIRAELENGEQVMLKTGNSTQSREFALQVSFMNRLLALRNDEENSCSPS